MYAYNFEAQLIGIPLTQLPDFVLQGVYMAIDAFNTSYQGIKADDYIEFMISVQR